jgi:hypothetical protein
MQDFCKREITSGNQLVYPVRRGSKLWLRQIKVTIVRENEIHGIDDRGRFVTVRTPSRCVVVGDTPCP